MTGREIEQEMFSYYNERAEEHDLVYMGKGPALQQYSDEYKKDVAEISGMASGFGRGEAIDIACGTGFWAPYYAPNCNHVTFVDQSANMLSECKKRVGALQSPMPPHFFQGNFFDIELSKSAFDCALVGFLLSHLVSEQEEAFFGKLKEILRLPAELMIIDSAWNEKREKLCQKSGVVERVLENGRKFRIYKKYFDQSEIHRMLKKYGYAVRALYVGDMLIAGVAERVN
jgi:ubiquinone/menaquinone biosynthesis C-methylase UbiE